MYCSRVQLFSGASSAPFRFVCSRVRMSDFSPCSCSRSIARWTAAVPASTRQALERATDNSTSGRRRGCRTPRPRASWASQSLRRSMRAFGTSAGVRDLEIARQPEQSGGAKSFQVIVFQAQSGPATPAGLVDQRPEQARSAPASCPISVGTAGRRQLASSLATAALRISARTTSSVIRALCASRSANWSRAGRVRNPRRHARASCAGIRAAARRRVEDLCSAAARSSRYSRYGCESSSCSWYAAVPAALLDEAIGIFPRRQHGHVDLKPSATSISDDFARPPPGPAASGSKLSTTFDANRRSSWACAASAPCRTTRPRWRCPAWNACAQSK